MLPGGQGSLVATNTEKLVGNRSIRRQARFVEGSTNKKVQHTCSHEISLFDQLRPGLLGKVGVDTSLHARTERMPGRSFPSLHFHPWRLSMICALLNKAPSTIALVSGVCQPASKTEQMVAEIGPAAWVQRRGVCCQNGSLFPPDLTSSASCVDIETSPHCDPLADLFNSGGSLWHSVFAEEPYDRGNSARFCFAHHRTHFEVFAHRIDLCGGRAPARCCRRFEQGVCP